MFNFVSSRVVNAKKTCPEALKYIRKEISLVLLFRYSEFMGLYPPVLVYGCATASSQSILTFLNSLVLNVNPLKPRIAAQAMNKQQAI